MKCLCHFPKTAFPVGLGLGLLAGVLIGNLLFRQPPGDSVRQLRPRDLEVGVTTIAQFKERVHETVVSASALGPPRNDPAEPYIVEYIDGMMYFFNTDEKFLGVFPESRGLQPEDSFECFRTSEVGRQARESLLSPVMGSDP